MNFRLTNGMASHELMCLLREFFRPSKVPKGGDTGMNRVYSKIKQKEPALPSARCLPYEDQMAVDIFLDDEELNKPGGDSGRPRVWSFRVRSSIYLALLANMPLGQRDEECNTSKVWKLKIGNSKLFESRRVI